MREILFRGKNPVNGEWFYGSLILEKNAFDERLILAIISDADANETLVNPETVGQYTGLTDKNDKKIFEGDICKTCICKYDMSEEDVVGKIYFIDGAFEFVCEYGEIYVYDILDASEVIGNIHGNPELLTE